MHSNINTGLMATIPFKSIVSTRLKSIVSILFKSIVTTLLFFQCSRGKLSGFVHMIMIAGEEY